MTPATRQRRLEVEGARWLCRAISPAATRESLVADWPRPELWRGIVAAADTHRLIPALAAAIGRRGVGERIDPELADLLAVVAAWNAERNEGLRRQMLAVSRAFNAEGLRPVWLKGALSLMPAKGPESGRMMLDLDLWLPAEADQRAGLAVLTRLGYAPPEGDQSYFFQPGCQHYPPYLHPDETASIELHRTVVAGSLEAVLPSAEAAAGIEWLDFEGTRVGRLDAEFRALCSLVQCIYAGPWTAENGGIPLMKAFDFVGRIHDDFGGRLPPALVERVVRAGWETPARRVFTLAATYFGLANPLPADRRLVRAMERRVLSPRLQVLLTSAGAVFGRRGLGLLRQPARIPIAFSAFWARLAKARSAGEPVG